MDILSGRMRMPSKKAPGKPRESGGLHFKKEAISNNRPTLLIHIFSLKP